MVIDPEADLTANADEVRLHGLLAGLDKLVPTQTAECIRAAVSDFALAHPDMLELLTIGAPS